MISSLVGPRNSKQRLVVFLLVAFVFLMGIYVLRDTHIKLKEAKGTADHCQQQQESLSAQLQVVYEHKTRLEKSLQQEKLQHKNTKEEILAQYQELQDIKEKEKQEAGNRFSSLQQQHKMLQIQNEDLQEELSKIQETNVQLVRDKQQYESMANSQADLVKKKDADNDNLKAKISALQLQIEALNRDMLARDRKIQQLTDRVSLCEGKHPGKQVESGGKLVNVGGETVQLNSNNNALNLQSGKEIGKKDERTKHSVLNNAASQVLQEPKNQPGLQNLKDALSNLSPKEVQKRMAAKISSNVHRNVIAKPESAAAAANHGKPAAGAAAMPDGEAHQLARPDDPLQSEYNYGGGGGQGQQLILPDVGRNLHIKEMHNDDDAFDKGHQVGRDEEVQPQPHNGLEQQEIGDDDPDNLGDDDNNNGVVGHHHNKPDGDGGKAFEDADFDGMGDDIGPDIDNNNNNNDDHKHKIVDHESLDLAPL